MSGLTIPPARQYRAVAEMATQASKSEFSLVSVDRHADREFILRDIAAQRAVEFVPPAKNRAPVRIRLPFNN